MESPNCLLTFVCNLNFNSTNFHDHRKALFRESHQDALCLFNCYWRESMVMKACSRLSLISQRATIAQSAQAQVLGTRDHQIFMDFFAGKDLSKKTCNDWHNFWFKKDTPTVNSACTLAIDWFLRQMKTVSQTRREPQAIDASSIHRCPKYQVFLPSRRRETSIESRLCRYA